MAMKDWKLTRKWISNIMHWTNNKGIRIYLGKPTGTYGVEIADISGKYKEIYYKKFKTKSQALSYARDYMRKR